MEYIVKGDYKRFHIARATVFRHQHQSLFRTSVDRLVYICILQYTNKELNDIIFDMTSTAKSTCKRKEIKYT